MTFMTSTRMVMVISGLLIFQYTANAADPLSKSKKTTKTTKSTKNKSSEASSGAGAKEKSSEPLAPDLLSIKTHLEDLIIRRYSLDLGALIDRQSFSIGAQVELARVKPKDDFLSDDLPSDLTVGALDPESLLGSFGSNDDGAVTGALRNFRIPSLNISVGLKESLGESVKETVEKWLKDRLAREFGNVATGTVAFIREPTEKKPPIPPKGLLDWLGQFQDFAGQLAVAFAILLGALLWRSGAMSAMSRSKGDSAESASGGGSSSGTGAFSGVGGGGGVSGGGGAAGAGGAGLGGKADTELEALDLKMASNEQIARGIQELSSKLASSYEFIIRNWCQGGEEGMLKLACFAEAAGKDLGKLPVPADTLGALSKVFLSMPSLSPKARRDAMGKAYWDMLAVARLGQEALQQPFSYLAGMRVGMVNQILMDQNPKLKALVSLYMPIELRKGFIQSLDKQTKIDLIGSVAEMTEIQRDELDALDQQMKSQLTPDTSGNSVSLVQGLAQMVAALTPMDELELLPKITGPAIEKYRRTAPSLAFIESWKDEYLYSLLQRVSPDEVIAYLRIRPEHKDRILGFCPPMTAEVASEELAGPDHSKDSEKNQHLANFAQRVQLMVRQNEVDLERAFDTPSENASKSSGETGNAA